MSSQDSANPDVPPKNTQNPGIPQLASSGALSSNARVGIMLALLGVERITFTDLLLAVQVSKSSLNKSIKILTDEGYVTERYGFKATGGPRTFVQITDKGKTAIRSHLETMRRLTTKYLTTNQT